MTIDAKTHDIAVAYILKKAGGRTEWPFMVIGVLLPSLTREVSLSDGELVLLSAFFSPESWYAFTTRRIISKFQGIVQSLDPLDEIDGDFPNFKGFASDDDSDLKHPGIIARDVASRLNALAQLFDSIIRLGKDCSQCMLSGIGNKNTRSSKN